MKLAFYGRVSTEDAQDPQASRAWQLKRSRDLVSPLDHEIVAEFFDIGQSRSLPWRRRPQAAALLEEVKSATRRFDGIVIGEPQRAFYGHQFSMTFPVLTHYGVALFVPEVGGAVDPDSDAHEIVMSLFGGMSKSERTRIQKRTKSSMHELARNTDRFLGGRPPYGYRLADVGPHPNPAKAAAGQRAHRLIADETTASNVRLIFELYATGDHGLNAIAQRLTDEGIASPSASDPARNRHRDPRGWSAASVRAILKNPTYTGFRVWGKQEKVETLADVEDVAAGSVTRMRWREGAEWVRPEQRTHEAIVDPELFEAVAHRFAARAPSSIRATRRSTRPYPLAGLVLCGHCGRRMQGMWVPNRKAGTGRTLYRCEIGKSRAISAELADHPRSVHLNQAHVLPQLDRELGALLSDQGRLRAAVARPVTGSAELGAIRTKISETQKVIDNLVEAIGRGLISDAVTAQLAAMESEKKLLELRVSKIAGAEPRGVAQEIDAALVRFAGIADALALATDEERGQLYRALDLQLTYDSTTKRAQVTLDPLGACIEKSVRRGT
ncbi:recombinase family protein [Oerskovia flava]|uniref:recombinase family protein n=1 Tax=Oerskovia flava TaxID=2986422 RepID=UPI0022402726|nr:recombinase family protein [Oerskovia sp. JB1-3-2]